MNNHSTRNNLTESVEETAKQTVGFALLYHAADVQWIGGALVGNHIVEEYGANPWITASVIASAVTIAEYNLSNIALRTFEKKEDLDDNPGKIRRVINEIGASAYASFFGSANGVKINDSLGLESTEKRRKIQAGIFGAAVGLWVTPLPLFDDGAELAKDTLSDMFEDPLNFVLYSSVSVAGILGISKLAKETRKAYNRYKSKKVNLVA